MWASAEKCMWMELWFCYTGNVAAMEKKRGEFLLEEGFICVDLITDKPNSI
jgi:hypothetical protein